MLHQPFHKFNTTISEKTEEENKNVYSEPTADLFKIRRKDYNKTLKKINGTKNQYILLGVDFVVHNESNYQTPYSNIGKNSKFAFFKERESGFKQFVFIINFMMPFGNFIIYFTPYNSVEKEYCTGNIIFDKLITRFVEEDDEFRNRRFKIIPKLVSGNWMLKKVVNGTPALLCNKIATTWIKNLDKEYNYLEADINICSSAAAYGILSLVRNSINTVSCDLAFIIQGECEEELPEEIFCALRFHKLDPKKSPPFEDFEDKI